LSRPALRRAAYAILSLAVLVIDQASKDRITSSMTLYASIPVVRGLFHLTLVANRGALFGLFHDLADPYRSALFTAVPVLAILLIVIFQWRTTLADSVAQTGLALILGGALGNLADRLFLGYVVDFLDLFIGEHHWPAFNVADASICTGVGLLILDLLRKGRHRAPVPLSPEA
jgi:signal peptidase II